MTCRRTRCLSSRSCNLCGLGHGEPEGLAGTGRSRHRCCSVPTNWNTRYWHGTGTAAMPGPAAGLQSAKEKKGFWFTPHFQILCKFLVTNPNPTPHWERNPEECSFRLAQLTQLVPHHSPLLSASCLYTPRVVVLPFCLPGCNYLSHNQNRTNLLSKKGYRIPLLPMSTENKVKAIFEKIVGENFSKWLKIFYWSMINQKRIYRRD